MEALDDAGLEEYVRGLMEDYTEEGKSPVLSPEAISCIAHDLGQTPTMIRKATHFLMTQYEGEPGAELSPPSWNRRWRSADRRQRGSYQKFRPAISLGLSVG